MCRFVLREPVWFARVPEVHPPLAVDLVM